MPTKSFGAPTNPGPREAAIVEVAELIFQANPSLAARLDSPILREVTVGELAGVVRSHERGEDHPHRHLHSLPGAAAMGRSMRARLSDRELDVVHLIVEGLSNKEISVRLSLSDKTVKNHISHILAKLGLTARTQVAVLALRGGVA